MVDDADKGDKVVPEITFSQKVQNILTTDNLDVSGLVDNSDGKLFVNHSFLNLKMVNSDLGKTSQSIEDLHNVLENGDNV